MKDVMSTDRFSLEAARQTMMAASYLDIIWAAFTGLAIYTTGIIVYNIFFHPLRSYPGPLLFRATNLTKAYWQIRRRMPFIVEDLHARYGPIVRIGPSELAFTHAQAWNDIYSAKNPRGKELEKHEPLARINENNPCHIGNAPKAMHKMLRKRLGKGFSIMSIENQMPILKELMGTMMSQLRTRTENGDSVDLNLWFRFFTFDTIAKLTFGDDFGCIKSGVAHPWVEYASTSIRIFGFVFAVNEIGLAPLLSLLIKTEVIPQEKYRKQLRDKIRPRLEKGVNSGNYFVDALIQEKLENNSLTLDEIVANVEAILMAGADTTSIFLTAAVFILLKHPKVINKLTHEIRSSFGNEEEITMETASQNKYMLACLNEVFRICPVVTYGFPRLTEKGGTLIDGHLIPENTVVTVWQRAINHDLMNWKDPMEFRPERFMGDAEFAGDRLETMQPFSVGTRDCIGRNLSYAEARMILARLIYSFDMKLAAHSQDWMGEMHAALTLEHKELYVHLTPATR